MSATKRCTIQVYYGERSTSTNVTVPLTLTVAQVRQEVLKGIQNHIVNKWPGVMSPVETDASKVVILSDAKGVVNTDCNPSALAELGYCHNSILRAVVGARFEYPQAPLDPYIVQQPIRDQFDSVIEAKLSDERSTHETAMAKKEQELKNTKSTLSGVSKVRRALESEVNALKAAPVDKPAWFLEFEGQMKMMRSEAETSQSKMETMQSKMETSGNKMEALESKMETMQSKMGMMQIKIVNLQDENRALKKEVEDLLDDRNNWTEVGSWSGLQDSLGLRQLIDEAQSYLAKVAKLPEPTSLEWRKLLINMDDEERSRYVQNLLANCNDPIAEEILQSAEALKLITERRSDARKKGNKAAHRKPKRQDLASAIEKEVKAGRGGYSVLLNVLHL